MKKRKTTTDPSDVLVIDAINAMKHTGRKKIPSDTEGSYKGLSENGDHPVQDADDM